MRRTSTKRSLSGLRRGDAFPISSSHAALRITQVGLSTRARNVLGRLGIQTVGDFRRLTLQQIANAAHCGIKSRQEILRVAQRYAPSSTLVVAGESLWAPSPPPIDLSIPNSAKKWPLNLLPISVRLQNVLQRLHCRTLGDLKGISSDMIATSPDCGMRTVSGLASFLKRVRQGKFGAPREQTRLAPLPYAVRQADLFVESLPAHHRTILESRLGASGRPLTLNAIGQKFHMTRERVRQIVNLLVDRALRAGGPPLDAALSEFAGELTEKNLPLTPELLLRRTAALKPAPQRAPEFYIRLIGQLTPGISVWPGERVRPVYRTPEEEKILNALSRWFSGRRGDATFAEALAGIRASGAAFPATKFLNALKLAPEFKVALRDPEKPRLCSQASTGPRRTSL